MKSLVITPKDSIEFNFINQLLDKMGISSQIVEQEVKKTSLSKKQIKAIEEGLNQVKEGKILSNEQVMAEMKNRHPKYFI
jgi:predicted transcriptional regulator